MEKRAATPTELRGVVDGFQYPVSINGWATKVRGDVFLGDLHIEIRRGPQLIAQTPVEGLRRDVTKDDSTPAAFFIDLKTVATAEELLSGDIQVFAADSLGQSKELHLGSATQQKIKQDLAERAPKAARDPGLPSPTPFKTLQGQVKRLEIRRALIVTSMLRGLHGSPLVALDVGRVLASAGVTVEFLTLDAGAPLTEILAADGFQCFDPKTNPHGIYGASYDLVWGQHWPAYGFALLELKIATRYFALVSLSSFEPLESVQLLLPEADILVFNARATRDGTLESLPAPTTKPIAVTANALPPDWFTTPVRPAAIDRPRKIAVVSNHCPDEVRLAAQLLSADGIEVRFVGSLDQPALVDSEFVDNFDVIITIGHTVQKGLARARAVYCYDRFGGPGYIDLANLETAERRNFSGRDRPAAKSADNIHAEIVESYSKAITAADDLRTIAAERYRLDLALTGLLEKLTGQSATWLANRDQRSADRKLVRYAVNIAVNYPLFTSESAMASTHRQDIVALMRTVQVSEAIPFFREVNDSNPSLYAVSNVPRQVPIYGFILPAPNLEIRSIAARHDGGMITIGDINLPSPWLKNKFPEHPSSNVGRFNIQLILRTGIQYVDFVVGLSDGSQVQFLKIELQSLKQNVPQSRN